MDPPCVFMCVECVCWCDACVVKEKKEGRAGGREKYIIRPQDQTIPVAFFSDASKPVAV